MSAETKQGLAMLQLFKTQGSKTIEYHNPTAKADCRMKSAVFLPLSIFMCLLVSLSALKGPSRQHIDLRCQIIQISDATQIHWGESLNNPPTDEEVQKGNEEYS